MIEVPSGTAGKCGSRPQGHFVPAGLGSVRIWHLRLKPWAVFRGTANPTSSARCRFSYKQTAGTTKTAHFRLSRPVLVKNRGLQTIPRVPGIMLRFAGMIPGNPQINLVSLGTVSETRRIISATSRLVWETRGMAPGTLGIIRQTRMMISGTPGMFPGTGKMPWRNLRSPPGTPGWLPGTRHAKLRSRSLPAGTPGWILRTRPSLRSTPGSFCASRRVSLSARPQPERACPGVGSRPGLLRRFFPVAGCHRPFRATPRLVRQRNSGEKIRVHPARAGLPSGL